MASRFVRQPSGRLAVFSTVVDDFTVMNLTPEEALAWARDAMDLGPRAAAEKVAGAGDDGVQGEDAAGDGLSRWRAAIKTVRALHGADAADDRIAWDRTGNGGRPRRL